MPKMNRIRIVNFSYNYNNRHIIDECFDFYGGENALLSLANGGGKSVLVQAMLQPILPKVTLLNRKFGEFFISKKSPAYILIEWKLDDEAGYLLTGIGITNRMSHSANEEEESSDIRYFTFSNFYEEGNKYDLKNIPVTEQSGNAVRIASYAEFRKLLQKEAEKGGAAIKVFDSTREEQTRYDGTLRSYNISKDEWKELIVSINEAEHGVSEVFSECKTSRRVMEQWVIRYIEKVLNKSGDSGMTDHKKLETMMAQVAQSLVDHEEHIREYQEIGEFNRELEELHASAKTVLTRLDREGQLIGDIAGGYATLKAEEERLAEAADGMGKRQEELALELEGIHAEERSQEIHEYSAQLAQIDRTLLELAETLEKQNVLRKEWKQQWDVQKAAEKYSRIQEKRKEIAGLRQRLENASKDQEELAVEMNRIRYSLKQAYNVQLQGLQNEIEGLDAERKNVQNTIRTKKTELDAAQQEMERLKEEKGRISGRIEHFQKMEPGMLEKLEIKLLRNPLLNEIDARDIANTESMLEKERMAAEKFLQDCSNKAEMLQDVFSQLKLGHGELVRKKEELMVEMAQTEKRLEDFRLDREKLLEVLQRFNLKEEQLFDRGFLLKTVREDSREWENRVYHLKMEISELEKQIHGIEHGVSYLPDRLLNRLAEQNLSCYTGEKYLRDIPEEEKRRLLAENPFLPYALLVTDKEMEQVRQHAADMELTQIVPMLRYNRKDQPPVWSSEEMQFITSAGNILLDNRDITAYVESLKESRNTRVQELERVSNAVDRVNQDYQFIAAFEWTQEKAQELEQRHRGLQEELIANGKALQVNLQETAQAERQQQDVNAAIEASRKDILAKQNRIAGFQEYLLENASYMENVALVNGLQGKIQALAANRRKLEEAREALEEKAKDLRSRIEEQNRWMKEIQGRVAEVAQASETELLDAGVPELEGRLQACEGRQNNEVADLNDRIGRLNRDVQDTEKDIRKLKLETDEYENMEYSEAREAELERKYLDVDGSIAGLKEEDKGYQIKRAGLLAGMENSKKALGGKPVLPVEAIRGHFSQRRDAVFREKDEILEQVRKYNQEKTKIMGIVLQIEARIKGIVQMKTVAGTKSFPDVILNMKALLEEYEEWVGGTNQLMQLFSKSSNRFVDNYLKKEEGTVKEAVKGLKSQLDALDRSYDKYYYLTERMDYYVEQLANMLKILESKMEQLEHIRLDLTEHAFMEASRIYHELPKISENSVVEIDGARRKVLEILYDDMGNELEARDKMNTYIRECLESLTKLIKGKEDDNRLRREIEKCMATKELLNIVSSLEKCRVRAYKVDLNEKNRRMMLWEDIIVKNSGGEKFVAYFSLLVALISYSRKQIKGYEAFRRREESKVLIMDNPFGPITSGHLLKPMFDIARKYNTQLICLSDIKQGDVINSFDLIYMIKIRQNSMQEDFLELEPILQKEMKQDEKLENAYMYSKVEQMSLFD